MASVSMADVLGAPQLCGSYETVKGGVPDIFPPAFYTVDQEVEGNKGSYFQSDGQRQTSRLTAYGASSTSVQLKGTTEVPVILYHVAENFTVPMTKMAGLIRPDSSGSDLLIDEKGVKEISKHVKNSVIRVRNLKTAVLGQLFSLGNNYWDGVGNLLPSSSGAKTTSASQIAAANIGALTSVLSGQLAWGNPASDIEDTLIQLDQLAMDSTGYPIRYAIYGRNIPKYMSNNSKMTAYLARNPVANDLYVKNSGIAPLGNMTWIPGYQSSFRDQNDVTQRIVGDDQVTFVPEPDTSWLGWINGSTPIPGSIDIEKDAMAALANVQFVHGDYMYAMVSADPVALKLVFGTTSLPTIRVPKAVFIITNVNG